MEANGWMDGTNRNRATESVRLHCDLGSLSENLWRVESEYDRELMSNSLYFTVLLFGAVVDVVFVAQLQGGGWSSGVRVWFRES